MARSPFCNSYLKKLGRGKGVLFVSVTFLDGNLCRCEGSSAVVTCMSLGQPKGWLLFSVYKALKT